MARSQNCKMCGSLENVHIDGKKDGVREISSSQEIWSLSKSRSSKARIEVLTLNLGDAIPGQRGLVKKGSEANEEAK